MTKITITQTIEYQIEVADTEDIAAQVELAQLECRAHGTVVNRCTTIAGFPDDRAKNVLMFGIGATHAPSGL